VKLPAEFLIFLKSTEDSLCVLLLSKIVENLVAAIVLEFFLLAAHSLLVLGF
jgi:hypothetical protein